jgi:uracil-DNA glycosylase
MHTTIYELLAPETRARMIGLPTTELLAVKLDQLEGFPKHIRTELHDRYGVTTLRDLQRVDLTRLQIDPSLIQLLICLFQYPKHDPGPGCQWEELFEAAPLAYYQSYSGSPFHTRFAPVFYRGRLDGTARVLVVGQDPSTDESLSGRTFVGQAGQLAQNFLAKIGITHSYVMFNTFLYGVQSGQITNALATDATITAYRNQLLDRAKATNTFSLVLAFGSWAETSVTSWPGLGALPFVHVTHPTAQSGVAANWNSHLATAASHVTPDPDGHVDLTPYNTSAAIPSTDIPRRDLPFGTPTWQGTGGGTHSARGSGSAFETQIIWTAP